MLFLIIGIRANQYLNQDSNSFQTALRNAAALPYRENYTYRHGTIDGGFRRLTEVIYFFAVFSNNYVQNQIFFLNLSLIKFLLKNCTKMCV